MQVHQKLPEQSLASPLRWEPKLPEAEAVLLGSLERREAQELQNQN